MRDEELHALRTRFGSVCPAWHALGDDASDLCLSILHTLDVTDGDTRKVLCGAMFERLLRCLQGGLLLVSVGLRVQAQLVARAGVEAFILLSAFAEHPDAIDRYLRSDHERYLRLLGKLRKVDNRADIASDDWFAEMEPLLRERAQGAAKLDLAKLADETGTGDVYRTVYAALSGPSHHLPSDVLRELRGEQSTSQEGVLDGLISFALLGVFHLGKVFGFDGGRLTKDLSARRKLLLTRVE